VSPPQGLSAPCLLRRVDESKAHDLGDGGSMHSSSTNWTKIEFHIENRGCLLGEYLVMIGSCNDCHRPGYSLGRPDFSRILGGSDVAFGLPGLGAFVGRKLTPDKETGLGNWTDDQIISAFTAGSVRMAGSSRRSCVAKSRPSR